MKTCANCECELATVADEYGPPGMPVCFECHMGIRPEREPDGLAEARRAVVEALAEARERTSDAGGLRDEADELEREADDLRREISERYGLDWPQMRTIEQALGWKARDDDVDWAKLPPLKLGGKPAVPGSLTDLPLFSVAA